MQSRAHPRNYATRTRDAGSLRVKVDKVGPQFHLQRDQSPLFNTLTPHPQNQEKQVQLSHIIIHQVQNDHDFFLPKNNRIYNNHKDRIISNYRAGNRLKDPRNSLHNLRKQEEEPLPQQLTERPQSTSTVKAKMTSEIFRSNNDVLNYQHRPGSSKSSRLFKRKGPFNNTINSQNEEGESLFRVQGVSSNRAGTSYMKSKDKPSAVERKRGGTSVGRAQKTTEKVPQKLDPAFYRLFAQ